MDHRLISGGVTLHSVIWTGRVVWGTGLNRVGQCHVCTILGGGAAWAHLAAAALHVLHADGHEGADDVRQVPAQRRLLEQRLEVDEVDERDGHILRLQRPLPRVLPLQHTAGARRTLGLDRETATSANETMLTRSTG